MRAFRSAADPCERAREWVSLRLDGELSEFEHALLDGHLERCGGCAEFAREVSAATFALRGAPRAQLGRPIVLPVRSRRILRPLTGFAAAAAIATVVGLGTLVGSFGSEPQRPKPATPAAGAADVASPASADDDVLLRRIRLAQLKANARQGGPQRGLGIPV
jgi:hypothetical protein